MPPELMTNSRRRSLRTCPRKHYYAYEIGLRRIQPDAPLRIGSAAHLGLYLEGVGGSREDAIVAGTVGMVADMPYEAEAVGRMLMGYWWRWSEVEEEIVLSERAFTLPIEGEDYWLYAGRIDKAVITADGRRVLREHKTTSLGLEPDSSYWPRLRIDGQASLYVDGAAVHGFETATVEYDVLHKPALVPGSVPILDADGLKVVLDASGERVMTKQGKPRQTASAADGYVLQTRPETAEEYGERITADIVARPDFYYARHEVVRLEPELEESRREFADAIAEIEWRRGRRCWPRNDQACSGMGRCPNFDLCSGGADLDIDAAPEGYHFVENVHPELKGEDNDCTA